MNLRESCLGKNPSLKAMLPVLTQFIQPAPQLSLKELQETYRWGFGHLWNNGLAEKFGNRSLRDHTPLVVVNKPSLSTNRVTTLCKIIIAESSLPAATNSSPHAQNVCPHIFITLTRAQGPILALVDSGSEVTCIEENTFQALTKVVSFPTLPVSSTFIQVATGQQSARIKVQALIKFRINSSVKCSTVFLVVKNLVRSVILGSDWLQKYSALIDYKEKTLSIDVGSQRHKVPFDELAASDFACRPTKEYQVAATIPVENQSAQLFDLSETMSSLQALKQISLAITTITKDQQDILFRLLQKFQIMFNERPGCVRSYQHHIKLHDYTPFIRRPYPVAFSLRPKVEQALREMVHCGVIKREPSSFASPMTVVAKKDGSIRICLDARWLNKQMVSDTETPRTPEDLFHSFPNFNFMSTLDLTSSYWQIPLSPESCQYTAFLYNGQSYTYQVLPFGLKTAVGSFSRAMDFILGPEVRSFTLNYIDDLLIISNSFSEHVAHLEAVFHKLDIAGMTVNLKKSSFCKPEVSFLGHILTPNGIAMDPEKVDSITGFPIPKCKKHLQAFLGLCNYYRRFHLKYSQEMSALTHLLKKDSKWTWGDTEQHVFERVKALFLKTVILRFPDFAKVFYLQTDSSSVALGVELYQMLEQSEHGVLGFASRKLQGPELLYTVTEKELLAIIFGLKKFQTILAGYRVIIRTDHHALKFLKQCRLLNERLTRWSLFLSQFHYEVEYVKGVENIVADTLSRYPPGCTVTTTESTNCPLVAMETLHPLVAQFAVKNLLALENDFQNVANYQQNDPFWGPLCRAVKDHTSPAQPPKLFSQLRLYQGILFLTDACTRQLKLVLPAVMVNKLIWAFHAQFGHFGASKVFLLMKKEFYFANMRRRIRQTIRGCEVCQKAKFPNRYLEGSTNPIIAKSPGDLVTVDYYGPLPAARSKATYIFVIIDSFSKFIKLYPLRRAQAKISVKKLLEYHQLIPIKVVLSDHGTQFQSNYWREMLRMHHIQPTFSSIRHPESNPTERVMRELNRLFRTYCHKKHTGWVEYLGKIEWLFNSTPHLTTQYSPFEILKGANPPNPLSSCLLPYVATAGEQKSVAAIQREVQQRLTALADKRLQNSRHQDKFNIGDMVLLRQPTLSNASVKFTAKFALPYSGPFRITNNPYANVYTLMDPVREIAKGNFNIKNLKLYYRPV